jgi:hypothetical protein
VVCVVASLTEEIVVVDELIGKFSDALVPFAEIGAVSQQFIAIMDLVDHRIKDGSSIPAILVSLLPQSALVDCMVQLVLAMEVRLLGWIGTTWVRGRRIGGGLFIEVFSEHGVVGRNLEAWDVVEFIDVCHGRKIWWGLDGGIGGGKGNIW